MYEQLPVPFGLVRYGVAPDHPEVKVFRRNHRPLYQRLMYFAVIELRRKIHRSRDFLKI
jgi:adrenodoxin-NADP+ reductase